MNLKFAKILGLITIMVLMGIFGYMIYLQKNDKTSEVKLTDNITKPTKKETSFTFMLSGDVMLGRAVAWKFNNDVTQAFEKLGQNFFSDKNLGLINLEGPISSENIKPNPTADNFVFNFPFNSISALKYLGINAVSQGSNHSENQGKSGLAQTKALLLNEDIVVIGSQTTFDENSIAEFKGENINLSVITINTLSNKDDLTTDIKREKAKGNLVMVFPHWGVEYQLTHSQNQQELAHAWIDAGADIIIGSHPHVVQDAEIYKNKFIFYSLGNLIFDQNFSTETQRGMILSGKITDKSTEITFMPTKIVNYQVELLRGSEKDTVINQFKNELGSQYFQGDSLEIKND